jgi:hypothetical protein
MTVALGPFLGRAATSESTKEESVIAKPSAISSPPSLVLPVVIIGQSLARDTLLFGWCLSPRRMCRGVDFRTLRCRFRLSGKHSLRPHVGRGCRCGDKSLYWIGTPDLCQTGALAGDYRRRTGFQCCIRNKQQCNKCKTCRGQKGECWHCRVPTAYLALQLDNQSWVHICSRWTKA